MRPHISHEYTFDKRLCFVNVIYIRFLLVSDALQFVVKVVIKTERAQPLKRGVIANLAGSVPFFKLSSKNVGTTGSEPSECELAP